jgi:hypothetical protein
MQLDAERGVAGHHGQQLVGAGGGVDRAGQSLDSFRVVRVRVLFVLAGR